MRLSAPPALLSLLLLPLDSTNAAPAFNEPGYNFLLERSSCDGTLCGYNDQLCCAAGSACYTDTNDQAQCTATAGGSGSGGWTYYTSTYVETDLETYTSVYSSWSGGSPTSWAPSAETTVSCTPSAGESACGAICCASGQYCYQLGQCMANGYSSMTTGSAALRPTSGSATVTKTYSTTTTVPFEPPASATATSTGLTVTGSSSDNSSNSLSGGEIAGIVIGVLVGIFLLALLCFCCIIRGLWHGLFAIFGLGPKGNKRQTSERVEVIDERYSRHGSSGASRPPTQHGGWFGGGGGRPTRVQDSRKQQHKTSGTEKFGLVAAALGGIALILGLKRKEDKKNEKTAPPRRRDSVSSYSYTESSYFTGTTESSFSDDRRTRATRDSRGTRNTRGTRR